MSPKEKGQKSKEELKEFTVGSVQPKSRGAKAKPGAAKGSQGFEIKEKEFPILTGLMKSKDLQSFQSGMKNVLVPIQELAEKGNDEEKAAAKKVQKAYAMALALVENSKAVR